MLLSVVVVACGANADTTTAAAQPQPTTTINLNGSSLTPTPTLPPQACGVWLLNSSPTFDEKGVITIYAKFIKNDENGNPVGIGGAGVNFNITWGDLSTTQLNAVTTSDGLAVANLPMAGHVAAINRLSLITAQFSSGNVSCQVDNTRPQSFVVTTGTKTTGTVTPGTGGKRNRKPGN
ncbi:hypothetical protein [Dictyobacter kobayashii]|uniref:hypothetical protein n=1 Tax=Dictyobacter kobayashii TaxID=2014872 RepID=UPI000F8297A8|nr:hypothetical protein [Dictyobacter kobayashii]